MKETLIRSSPQIPGQARNNNNIGWIYVLIPSLREQSFLKAECRSFRTYILTALGVTWQAVVEDPRRQGL